MYFCILNLSEMKKHIHLLSMAALLLVMVGILASCQNKDYHIWVSTQDFRFGLSPDNQTIMFRADFKWSIQKNDNEDWYTISPMSGTAKDSIVTVTVKDYSEGDYRGTTFVVNSPGGHVHRTIFMSQNKIDFDGMINKVFGAASIEHWNTDYFNQIIEDSYRHWEYNPYDTTDGQLMYFLEDGKGIQRNRVLHDYPIYFPFEYEYDRVNNILHIEFELEDGDYEVYNWEVLCASDSLYRVYHEYKPHWFERADMRKIGVINPSEKARLIYKATKRKRGEPVFIME